jgi:hypothetical protein
VYLVMAMLLSMKPLKAYDTNLQDINVYKAREYNRYKWVLWERKPSVKKKTYTGMTPCIHENNDTEDDESDKEIG